MAQQQFTSRSRKNSTEKAAPAKAAPPSKFNVHTLEQIADDLKTGKIPVDRVTISDEIVTGLRAIVRNTGQVTYHINYAVAGSGRMYLKIGDHPHTTMTQARQLAQTVKALGEKGIDPQEGLHERLIRELLDKGEKWKP